VVRPCCGWVIRISHPETAMPWATLKWE
jgi:hypothetical protein